MCISIHIHMIYIIYKISFYIYIYMYVCWVKISLYVYICMLSNIHICICMYIFFLSRGIILWIELLWSENPANIYAQHTETLFCFDLIRSHQQCIPWFPPQEIKPVTTDWRAETQQLSHQSISHTCDAKLTSHGNCTAN